MFNECYTPDFLDSLILIKMLQINKYSPKWKMMGRTYIFAVLSWFYTHLFLKNANSETLIGTFFLYSIDSEVMVMLKEITKMYSIVDAPVLHST